MVPLKGMLRPCVPGFSVCASQLLISPAEVPGLRQACLQGQLVLSSGNPGNELPPTWKGSHGVHCLGQGWCRAGVLDCILLSPNYCRR